MTMHRGNRKSNLGHGHGHIWGQKDAIYPRQFGPRAWPYIVITGSQIWVTSMVIHRGNRKPNLGHGHGHAWGQQEAIYSRQFRPRIGVIGGYISTSI